MLANGGKQIKPSLIDRIQDRYGKTIFRHEERSCENCNAGDWENQDEPTLIDNREQVLDPMTAYQITSMMEGVVTRGTAAGKIKLEGDVAGKTGTAEFGTESPPQTHAWFTGFQGDIAFAVLVEDGGFGGQVAAPLAADFLTKLAAG